MEQVTINNTPVVIDTTPAILSFNFEEMKAALETELEKYRVVVTADTVADAKKLATDLNKTKAVIATRRKDEVAKASEPAKLFESQVKELEGMIETGRQDILAQVKKFEDETRELARSLLLSKRAELWDKHRIETKFQNAQHEDLVMVSSVTKTGNLTAKAASEVESRVMADKVLQDRTKMRLLELENASYKAGLSAPLTGDHVAGFLLADDATYASELERILSAEVRREEEAQKRMRERMEREQKEREQKEREDSQRRESMAKEYNAPDLGKTEEPEPVPQLVERQSTTTQEDHNQSTSEALVNGTGKIRVTVTATFTTRVNPKVSNEEIRAELRKQLENAGITTLSSVTVAREKRS